MEFINKIELVGKVGSVQQTKVGDADLTIITIMTQDVFKKDDAVIVECCWFEVSYFGKVELTKGDSARAIGRLRQTTMTNSSGYQSVNYEVIANTLEKVD